MMVNYFIKEIDSDLERKIIDFWSFSTYVGTYDEEGNGIVMSAQNILDISIYDMFDNEVLVKKHSHDTSEVIDK